jgi:hypothetical protein
MNMFGNPVASSCVSLEASTFRGDTRERETSGSLEKRLLAYQQAVLSRAKI